MCSQTFVHGFLGNKHFSAVIDHTPSIFPTKVLRVTHDKATTSRVNYSIVRCFSNKETRPRSARSFWPISVKNLMWRHATHFTIRLRSSFCTCSSLWFVLCSALHTSCQLPPFGASNSTTLIWCSSLSSLHESCTVIFNNVQNFKYNWRLGLNSVICLFDK